MQIFEKVVNGNKYQFVSEYYETSKTWGHKSELIKNGRSVWSYKVRYINRTWENYTYQSVMQGLLNSLIENEKQNEIAWYKSQMGIERISKKDKEELLEKFETIPEIADLIELQKVVRMGEWD